MSTKSDTALVIEWVAGIPLSTVGKQTSIVTTMPNRIIEAARRVTEQDNELSRLWGEMSRRLAPTLDKSRFPNKEG